eukprot:scaffold13289_cov59-Phaeocystis_antarctica.AAC.5
MESTPATLGAADGQHLLCAPVGCALVRGRMHGSGQKARLNLERDLATVVLGSFGARLVRTRGERRRWRGLRHGRWGRRRQDGFAPLGNERLLTSCETAAHRELATVN